MEKIQYKGCKLCCFIQHDTLSGYPYCNFPAERTPDSIEVIEALKYETAPDSCRLRHGGIHFEVVDEASLEVLRVRP